MAKNKKLAKKANTTKKTYKISTVKQLTQADAIYIAGFIDGDGSIIAQIKPNSTAGYKLKHQMSLTVQLTQRTKRLEHLSAIRNLIEDGTANSRTALPEISDLKICSVNAIYDFLEQIKPYLRIKKKQAELVQQIILLLKKEHSTQNPEQFLEMCELADQVSALNDSKNRKNTSETVRATFRELGFIE